MKYLMMIFLMVFTMSGIAIGDTSKKFQRALVIAGGGFSPGVGLGMIAGAQAMGWDPDVVITTCGSSMSSGFFAYFGNTQKGLEYMKSRRFFELLSQVEIQTSNVFALRRKFATLNQSRIPQLFEQNLLVLPEQFEQSLLPELPHKDTPRSHTLHYVMTSSKALFTKRMVGSPVPRTPLFQQVYFADAETGQALHNFISPVQSQIPQSFVSRETQVISDQDIMVAVRSSIADPHLLNPGRIGNDYFFSGAVDLFPMELAHHLADEILITFPERLFQEYEELAISSSYGLSQNGRLLSAIQDTTVKWIDIWGISDLKMDPRVWFFTMKSGIPNNLSDFVKAIQAQYDFGYERVTEALQVQTNRNNVRFHLRRAINPKLINGMICENAFEWVTDNAKSCMSDDVSACDRRRGGSCTVTR